MGLGIGVGVLAYATKPVVRVEVSYWDGVGILVRQIAEFQVRGYPPNVWLGLRFLGDQLLNFRFSGTLKTCGWG